MPPVHVLVDLENNQPKLDDVKGLVPDITHAWLFHSPQQANRLASFAPMGAQQTPVPISRPGKNALDFHLAFYLGYIAARNPGAKLVVVAIDRGYGPMVEHAKALDIEVTQVGFKAGAARPRKAAVKKAVAGKASAKRTPAATTRATARRVAGQFSQTRGRGRELSPLGSHFGANDDRIGHRSAGSARRVASTTATGTIAHCTSSASPPPKTRGIAAA